MNDLVGEARFFGRMFFEDMCMEGGPIHVWSNAGSKGGLYKCRMDE